MGVRVGAQTIPWGETIKEQMPTILAFLSSEGYAGVETGMRHFDATRPAYYRELYAKHEITPLGLHSGGQFWLPDAANAERDKLDGAVQFAAAVGFRWVVVSGNKEETPTSMREASVTYSELGKRCEEQGLGFAYHNHDWELANDCTILEVLLENTGREVSLVLDIAWAHVAGLDPDVLLERTASRIAYLHIKDVRNDAFCELGTGDVDFGRYRRQIDGHSLEWIVVEQDETTLGAEESMRINRAYLRDLGY